MLTRDPVLKELNRRVVTERGVTTTPVVEHFDVVEQIGDRVLSVRVARAVHPLVLQAVEEALRRRVVPAVALRLIEQIMAYSVSLSWNAALAY